VIVEAWHSDRIKKDTLLGVAKFPLGDVLKQDYRKTKEGYLVSYDAWIPIDEVDESGNSLKKIGVIRAVVFLEDLGPLSMLNKTGFSVKNYIDEDDP
jgi:hypothetical protein